MLFGIRILGIEGPREEAFPSQAFQTGRAVSPKAKPSHLQRDTSAQQRLLDPSFGDPETRSRSFVAESRPFFSPVASVGQCSA